MVLIKASAPLSYWVLFVLLILPIPDAGAYLPDIDHEPILHTAIKVYSQCFPSHTLYKGEKPKRRITKGNLAMDKGLLSFSFFEWLSLAKAGVFSITKRPLNWHFFNPHRKHLSRVAMVEQSHVNLWEGLKKGFKSNSKKYNKLIFIGGLIHLIEDLTVPAHVVPVYHGPTAVKILGPIRLEPLVSYMQDLGDEYTTQIFDKIELIPPDIDRLETELLNNDAVCTEAGRDNETLEQIRLLTSLFTLNTLTKEISGCPGVTWQNFWIKPKNNEYFGRYNVKQNNPLFGENGLLHSEDGATCRFSVNDIRYDDFVYILHLKAIEADLKVLTWGYKNIGKR